MEITVVTPTYNRAHTLERTFNSLQKQTNKEFIWIVIDDGSSDNTKELIEKFEKVALFPMEYYYKENGGRHTALNESYKYIKTKYVVNLDSDDEFVEDAIQKMLDIWKSIPEDKYDNYWCIVGRCIDSKTRKMVGREFPVGINEMRYGYRKSKAIYQVSGEKSCCRRFDILSKYPFPIYKDTSFVREGIVWGEINNKYDQWCTNEIFRVYYQNEPDGLCLNNRKRTKKGACSEYYFSAFCVNKQMKQILYNKEIKKRIINVSRMGFIAGKTPCEILAAIEKIRMKLLVICGMPLGYLCYLKERKRYENE